MSHRLMLWALYTIEVMFYAGVAGCVLVVIVSWISIFRSGFTDKD